MIEAGMRVARIAIDDAGWWRFVSGHAAAGPFHLPAWTQVIAGCYRFESFALVVRDDAGEIVAGGPVVVAPSPLGRPRWVSLSFSDVIPLLVRPGTDMNAVTDALTEYVLASDVRELEVRAGLPEGAGRYPVEVGYLDKIALPSDPADLHVRKNHRNLAHRAQKAGVRLTRGNSAADLDTFYKLHTLTRRRLGVPVQPRRFFDLIGEHLLSQGHGFVITAIHDDVPVSSAVYLSYNGTLVSKFHATGATRPEIGASQLVDWEVMSAACVEGYHTLDLGRTDPGSDGLRLYKAGWGAVETPLIYTHISNEPPDLHFPKQGNLSKRIIRSSPTWVCRALGEVLYRWTA